MPDLDVLASLVPALVELVTSAKIRILDLVAIEKSADGAVAALKLDAVESLAALRDVEGEVGGMLSEHDIELAALALRPAAAGIVLVTEDRWAESLSGSQHGVGGRILGGERIPASRVETVLTDRSDDRPERGLTVRGIGTTRSQRTDLLARPPCSARAYEDGVRGWLVDSVEQLDELADLLHRGLLSPAEFELHKAKILGI